MRHDRGNCNGASERHRLIGAGDRWGKVVDRSIEGAPRREMKPGWDFLYWFAGAVCRRLMRWIENCLNTAVIVADALREGDIELLRVA